MSTDQIALVMEMMARDAKAYAEAEEARKAKGRERVAKWRADRSNVTVTQQNVTERLTGAGDTRGLDKTSIQRIEPQEDKKTPHAQSDVAAFKSALAGDVDPVTLDEFVKVRRKKRGALTGFAANLFREDALACSLTPQQAARECIRSSWITVKPEYFASRQRAGPRRNELADGFGVMSEYLKEKIDDRHPPQTATALLDLSASAR